MDLHDAEIAARSEAWRDRAAAGRVFASWRGPAEREALAQLLRGQRPGRDRGDADPLLRRCDGFGVEMFVAAYADADADAQVGDQLNAIVPVMPDELPVVIMLLRSAAAAGTDGAVEILRWLGL